MKSTGYINLKMLDKSFQSRIRGRWSTKENLRAMGKERSMICGLFVRFLKRLIRTVYVSV